MKKLLSALIAIILIFSTLSCVYAEGKTVSLHELYMNVSVPDGWKAFTRDSALNDPDAAALYKSGQSLKDDMVKNKIYLICLDNDRRIELDFTMRENNTANSTRKLLNNLEETKNKYLNALTGGSTLSAAEHSNKQMDYLVLDCTVKNGDAAEYLRQYITIVNGQYITLSFHSYKDSITDEMKAEFDGIVDNINYTQTVFKSASKLKNTLTVIIAAVLVAIVAVRYLMMRRKKRYDTDSIFPQPDFKAFEVKDETELDTGDLGGESQKAGFVKKKKQLDELLEKGILSPDEYRSRLQDLKDRFV
ncbi:MAG: hypothetical protein Q8865_04910 [Bacillota bacterium]|nr:hypothetical protein [Bacillota bacterium]